MSNTAMMLLPALKKSLEVQTGFEISNAIFIKEVDSDLMVFQCEKKGSEPIEIYKGDMDKENQFTSLMLSYVQGIDEPYTKMVLIMIFEPEKSLLLQRWHEVKKGKLKLVEQQDLVTKKVTFYK